MIDGTPHAPLQSQFLSAATWMLACNFRAMGGTIPGCKIPFRFIGELEGLRDFSIEMRLICAEAKRGHS